jgi:hypothetical protein
MADPGAAVDVDQLILARADAEGAETRAVVLRDAREVRAGDVARGVTRVVSATYRPLDPGERPMLRPCRA